MKKREILRYLGASTDTDQLDELIERAEKKIRSAARPRHIFRRFPISAAEGSVIISRTEISSQNLAAHLRNCKEAFLLALTLGTEVDSLIRRCTVTDMPLVPVLQACAAAYTEECADLVQQELQQIASADGLYLRPRYSPGYGDFELSNQKFLFSALDITKSIGITLTEDCLMIPFKSITAIIGISPDPSLCHIGKCMTCKMTDCPFRKE